MTLTFRSTADLVRDALEAARHLPRPSVVIGVPKSGMIPAAVMANHWQVPLSTPGVFARWCETLGHGERDLAAVNATAGHTPRPLIVDDSVNTGRSMGEAMDAVSRVCSHVDTLVIYDSVNTPHPRVYEWNLYYSWAIKRAAVDLDGVLCRDPTREENDDGERYRGFLWSVPPWRDHLEVGYIVTARLEKYRAATEAWLGRHRIKYRALYMLDATAEERRAKRMHASFKASVAKGLDLALFVESSAVQAEQINALAGLPVYCEENGRLYQ